MDRFERKKARLYETQETLKAKILEYKLIASLNSSKYNFNEELFNFDENVLKKKKFEEFLLNLVNFESKLPSKEFNNFLKENWSDSVTKIREKIQSKAFTSIEEAKLELAALLFNMNINLTVEETENRSKLIDAFNSVIQNDQ